MVFSTEFSKYVVTGRPSQFYILNVIRLFSLCSLAIAFAATWAVAVKSLMSGKYYFFDAANQFIVSLFMGFLIVTELGIWSDWVTKRFPLFGNHAGLVAVGICQLVAGFQVLGNLNETWAEGTEEAGEMGLGGWGNKFTALLIAGGTIICVSGALNIIASFAFRLTKHNLTARSRRTLIPTPTFAPDPQPPSGNFISFPLQPIPIPPQSFRSHPNTFSENPHHSLGSSHSSDGETAPDSIKFHTLTASSSNPTTITCLPRRPSPVVTCETYHPHLVNPCKQPDSPAAPPRYLQNPSDTSSVASRKKREWLQSKATWSISGGRQIISESGFSGIVGRDLEAEIGGKVRMEQREKLTIEEEDAGRYFGGVVNQKVAGSDGSGDGWTEINFELNESRRQQQVQQMERGMNHNYYPTGPPPPAPQKMGHQHQHQQQQEMSRPRTPIRMRGSEEDLSVRDYGNNMKVPSMGRGHEFTPTRNAQGQPQVLSPGSTMVGAMPQQSGNLNGSRSVSGRLEKEKEKELPPPSSVYSRDTDGRSYGFGYPNPRFE